MRRLASLSIGLCVAVSMPASALAAEPTSTSERPTSTFLSTPSFLSFGLLTTFANSSARGGVGWQASAVHWFKTTLDSPGIGAFADGEYVNGGHLRGSLGLQANLSALGVETGYAYASFYEGRRYVHAVQVTPFLSNGVLYIGVRTFVPVSGDAVAVMGVFGVKAPINVGAPMDLGNGPQHVLPH
jgi:hypothetical protein